MRAYKKRLAPKHPQTGFDRVITLTAEEVVEILRLMDCMEDPNPNFRVDTEGFVRRRLQGGPTIGKVAVVETVIFAIIRAGLLVLRQGGSALESASYAAPALVPSLDHGSGTALAIGRGEIGRELELEQVRVTLGSLSVKPSIEAGSEAAPSDRGVCFVEEAIGVQSAAPSKVGYSGTGALQNEGRGGTAPACRKVPMVGRDLAQEVPSPQPRDAPIMVGLWNRSVSESTIVAGFLMLLVIWIPLVIFMWKM